MTTTDKTPMLKAAVQALSEATRQALDGPSVATGRPPRIDGADLVIRDLRQPWWPLFVLAILLTTLRAFVVMLALGVLHALWPVIPALGFGPVLVLVLAVIAVRRLLK